MDVKLKDITPELVAELSAEVEEQKLYALTQQEVRALGDELDAAVTYASEVLARCQMRAMRLQYLGVKVSDIADMFDVQMSVVRKWLRSPVTVKTERVENV